MMSGTNEKRDIISNFQISRKKTGQTIQYCITVKDRKYGINVKTGSLGDG